MNPTEIPSTPTEPPNGGQRRNPRRGKTRAVPLPEPLRAILARLVSAMVGGRDRPATCIDCGTTRGVFATAYEIGDHLLLCSKCCRMREGRPQDDAACIDLPDTIRITIGPGLPGATPAMARAELQRMTDAAYAEMAADLDVRAEYLCDQIEAALTRGQGTPLGILDSDAEAVAAMTHELGRMNQAVREYLTLATYQRRPLPVVAGVAAAAARQWLAEQAGDVEDQGDTPAGYAVTHPGPAVFTDGTLVREDGTRDPRQVRRVVFLSDEVWLIKFADDTIETLRRGAPDTSPDAEPTEAQGDAPGGAR